MDTAVASGDFALSGNGRPQTISGAQELFQRAAIRLTVPLGAFSYDTSLGSRLRTLTGVSVDCDEKALSLAQEALRKLPQISVESAKYISGEAPSVKVTLNYSGKTKEVEVKL